MPVDSEQPKVDLIHVTDPNSPDFGRVKDVEAAHELANLVAEKGKAVVDVHSARENELATGLTQEQRNNLAAIDVLIQKYPKALILNSEGSPRFYDSSGKPFIVAKNAEGNITTLVITQDGVGNFIDVSTATNSHIKPMVTAYFSVDEIPHLGDYVSSHPLQTIDWANSTDIDRRSGGIRMTYNRNSVSFSGMMGNRYNVEENPGRIKTELTRAQEQHKDDTPPQPKISFLSQL